MRQDLLLDLLSRLYSYDPSRSPIRPFVMMCFEHHSARIIRNGLRENAAKHPVELDASLVAGGTVRVIDTLDEIEGYGAWIGQPTDRILELERRLDLDRALSEIAADVVPLCAAVLRHGVARGDARASRSTFHRRKHDLRCRLLAAGVGAERGTNSVVGE